MKFLLVTVALALAACQPYNGPNPGPTPKPDADAAPLPRDPCEAAFQYSSAMGCEPKGASTASWVEVCVNARANGQPFGLRCILEAGTLPAIKACGVDCVPRP